ncbi:hypothetical protein NON00_12230 [Roseomonas sp. GC11]|uniref:hypothetical protein n=1 Tax=Roseomonas sp. GC11 TaxID=2950546 RepID=UPI00210DF7FD|nr:hypothetical protein [Roseomonas sp. GC11]MCQ4160694.1 hypothetical protein [Roseomonas sp. GC11]
MDGVRNIVASLSIPGMPEWTGLLLLLLGLLCAAAFLLMPFSVFGLKARLDAMEVQLDEIQAELRDLALMLQEPALARRAAAPPTDEWAEPPSLSAQRGATPVEREAPRITPPVPPPPTWAQAQPRRAEPRLDWPRQR